MELIDLEDLMELIDLEDFTELTELRIYPILWNLVISPILRISRFYRTCKVCEGSRRSRVLNVLSSTDRKKLEVRYPRSPEFKKRAEER